MSAWICPKCGRVYGPLVMECSACNTRAQTGVSSSPSLAGYCLAHGAFNGSRCPSCSSAASRP